MSEELIHELVPKHSLVKDKEELLKKLNITFQNLPKISMKDPAIKHLDVKVGDVVEIKRKSKTAGDAVFYRGVINE